MANLWYESRSHSDQIVQPFCKFMCVNNSFTGASKMLGRAGNTDSWCDATFITLITRRLAPTWLFIFPARPNPDLCERVVYMWAKGATLANCGKKLFPCGGKCVCQLFKVCYRIQYRLCQKFSNLNVCLCTLWFPVASLAGSSMPRTWVINRKECALWFHAPKHTKTHSE